MSAGCDTVKSVVDGIFIETMGKTRRVGRRTEGGWDVVDLSPVFHCINVLSTRSAVIGHCWSVCLSPLFLCCSVYFRMKASIASHHHHLLDRREVRGKRECSVSVVVSQSRFTSKAQRAIERTKNALPLFLFLLNIFYPVTFCDFLKNSTNTYTLTQFPYKLYLTIMQFLQDKLQIHRRHTQNKYSWCYIVDDSYCENSLLLPVCPSRSSPLL